MSELESVQPEKAKRQAKPAEKKQRALKVLGVGAAAAVGAVAGSYKKYLGRSPIVIPNEHVIAAGSKVDASARRKLQMVLDDSLSTKQAAARLAVTTYTVVRRIRARSIYAIPYGGKWLVPQFQFRADALIRGMSQVLPRLNEKLHPLEVINWFSLPNADLVMSGKPVSPATWLERGGDIASVATLAADLGDGF